MISPFSDTSTDKIIKNKLNHSLTLNMSALHDIFPRLRATLMRRSNFIFQKKQEIDKRLSKRSPDVNGVRIQ